MGQKNEDLIRLICSSIKLERDKGVVELEKSLPGLNGCERRDLQKSLFDCLNNYQNSWETKHGSLLAAKSLISYLELEDERDCNFLLALKEICKRLVTDVEIRVRLAAGETLGSLCKKIGPDIYIESRETVLKLIQCNLDRNFPEDDSSKLEQAETGKLIEKLIGGFNSEKNPATIQIFKETAGWKNLETSLKALEAMIEGCGLKFQPYIDEELLSLIFQTLSHNNRFIREAGFNVCSNLVRCGNTNDSELIESIKEVNPVLEFGPEFCKFLAKGLADDWPQVRLSASVATRNFLLSLPSDESRQLFYPYLLPRICLNRYYAADGVRIYNQETWKQVTGTAGKELVEKYIEATVDYYKEATLSENHAVREAACASIAELACKVSSKCVRPFVNILLNTLLNCFQDESWAVRDAACLACGNFVQCFPQESKVAMKSLYPMFFRNLSDGIPSVRQGAASALACVVKAYGEASLEKVLTFVIQCLKNVKNQKQETESHDELNKEFAMYGFVKRMKDDNSESKNFSGNLKDPQPWESADGCVYLIGELSHNREIHNEVISLFPFLKEAARHRHYANHVVFHETICKQIPVLAKNFDKKLLKNFVEEFFDIIFYSLECENALTSSAASQCLSHMATVLGPNVLRGKVNNYNPNYGHCLESVIHAAPY